MKRRTFLRKTGAIVLQVPVILSSTSLASCKKETIKKPSTLPTNDGEPTTLPSNPQTPAGNEPAVITSDQKIISGYVNAQSYLPGDTGYLYVSANETIEKENIAVYNLNGKISFLIPYEKVSLQKVNTDAPYENGYGYTGAIKFTIPQLKSGLYLIANQIAPIVRSGNFADITIVYPSNTENAYCKSGDRSLYTSPVAKKVSFLRPIKVTFYAYGIFKWLNNQNYSYKVISDMDMDDYSNFNSKLLIIAGHNEYWTRKARANFDRFIIEGKDSLVLSGNTMWWQVRYNEEKNQLICYKTGEDPDPNPLNNTVLWTDPRLKYQIIESLGADFNGGGFGSETTRTGFNGFKIYNPSSPLLSGISIDKGEVLTCRSLEYDGAPIKGFDADGFPVIDNSKLRFYKTELLGYDIGYRNEQMPKTVATPLIYKKTATSGTVINWATTNWCSEKNFFADSTQRIVNITEKMIDMLLAKQNVFSS